MAKIYKFINYFFQCMKLQLSVELYYSRLDIPGDIPFGIFIAEHINHSFYIYKYSFITNIQ